MALWRVLKPLSKKHEQIIPAGSIVGLEWLDEEGLRRLQAVGAITRLSAPPLHKLPGWHLRAKRLREVHIVSAESFLEADTKALAEQIGADPRTVAKWKDELLGRWLSLPKTRQG